MVVSLLKILSTIRTSIIRIYEAEIAEKIMPPPIIVT